MWNSIRNLMTGGTTILLTTQYLEEADQLADRIIVIDDGKVIAEGTAKELKAKVGKDRLELVFQNEKDLKAAIKELSKDVADVNDKESSLTMVINDTNNDVRRVLDALATKKITLQAMAVHKPTLDDVFLSLTGKQKQDGEEGEA
jgi:ABC-2 type transport system ATP-binding protein